MRFISFCASIALAMCLPALVGCGSNTEVTAPVTPEASAEALSPEVTPVSFANDKCPIMGGKPKAELTADWDGKTIGFCCEGCPEKWAKLSEQERTEKFAAAAADSGAHAEHGDHKHAEHGDHEKAEHGDHEKAEHGDHENAGDEHGDHAQEPKGHADHQEQPSGQQ